ncbi:hypothetical protein HaLaN_04083 [Haematococcus lacustris]|uniref:Uncharacterized protein n=1 Tax=Haematococcus lacustris TaxID=44745 RepID=A0A699YFS6_HAELA|nr:hypothetical protein HaLaN_04083 [Haematococcus lacustris]
MSGQLVTDQLRRWKLTKGQANLKHTTVTLPTWDAVWEVYLNPQWARQRLRLCGAQDRALEQFFNKVVCRPRGTDQRWGRVVLVDEHHTSRVSSVVGHQACRLEAPSRAGGTAPSLERHHR